jgi:chemosensory pili system protein ChpA (sensor histidine kinase/response regulator)
MKHSALTWVKPTIDESLKQTRQALEQFVENPSDTAPLQQCVVWLHEIYGALNVLELQTAALLVQDVELTIKSLLAGKIDNNEATYDILMRSLIQLPNYLDHLAIVQRDMPVALLPLLNELRTLRKQAPLVANSLFTPDLAVEVPQLKNVSLADDKLKEYMHKMRGAYQKGLVTLIKNPKQAVEGLKFIYTVMQRLQQATGTAPVSKVWWITEGIIEALLQKGLEINNAILNLLKQLDVLIKQIVEHGNAALRAAPPKALLTNLLYFAAHAHSQGKQITEVKKVFKLEDYFPTESTLATARLVFAGPDIELMKIVVTLLKDDFARVEETLDIFNRADNPNITELSPLVSLLRDMANTLGLLGLLAQRQSMLAQSALILEISEGRKSPELATLLELANALLKINSALDILAVQGVHARQRLQQIPDTNFSETPQFKIILSVVVDEAKTELAQVIQPLVTFIDSNTKDEALLEVPSRLKQVEGCLSILSHHRAAKLLSICNRYIEKTFIKEAIIPAEDKLKALADVLISLELYLDTLAGNPMDGKNILDITEKRLSIVLANR